MQTISELSGSNSLFAVGGSCLSVDSCSLIREVVAEGWGDSGNFLIKGNSEGCHINWLFFSVSL